MLLPVLAKNYRPSEIGQFLFLSYHASFLQQPNTWLSAANNEVSDPQCVEQLFRLFSY